MYVTIWKFVVKQARQQEFERIYGPDGDWVRLFRSAPGYLGTELLRETGSAGVYLTLDHWASEEAFRSFRAQFGSAYTEMDERCQDLTTSEEEIGRFEPRR